MSSFTSQKGNSNYKLLFNALSMTNDMEEAVLVRVNKTLNSKTFGFFSAFLFKVAFLIRVILIPIKAITLFNCKNNKDVIMGFSNNSEGVWEYFVEHYFNKKCGQLSNERVNIRRVNLELIRLYAKMILFSLIWKPCKNEGWIYHLFYNTFIYQANSNIYDNVFVFYLNHPSSIVFSKFSEKFQAKLYMHLGNNPIVKWNNPIPISGTLITSSIIQEEEIKYLGLDNKSIYCRDEFILYSKDVEVRPPKFDIGFISSAEWARNNGLYRATNLESIKKYELADNIVYEKFNEGLEMTISLAKRLGFNVVIYPHPFERELMEKGIKPPYFSYLENDEVSIDFSGDSSRDKIYDCKIAISYHSSFIWERISLGLTSSYHFYFMQPEIDLVDFNAMGKYKENIFFDNNQIEYLITKNI